MSAMPQYEFSNEQNALIGNLATKMRFVGLFFNVVGALNLVMALLVVLAIYRDRVPQSWVDKLPANMKSQAEGLPLDKLPSNNHLWGAALNTGVIGLFYLLMGTWTRTAGGSFRQIVETQGRDISHLMTALAALHSMYTLVYTLLVVTLLLILLAIGLTVFTQMAG